MYEGKAEYEYDLNIHHVTLINESFVGEFDPVQANPFRRYCDGILDKLEERRKNDKTVWALAGRALKRN